MEGNRQNELVALCERRVEALAGKKVIGAVAGVRNIAVWTKAGELFTFGSGQSGRLGHSESVDLPRLVVWRWQGCR